MGLGFCLYWGPGWRPRVSQAHSLLVSLKRKSRNLKLGEGKRQVAQKVNYGSQSRSLKQRSLTEGRWPGTLSSVAGSVLLR